MATCVRHGYAGMLQSCSSEVNPSATMECEAAVAAPRPALRGLLYGTSERPPASETAPRVHWDEECIAEHDKERGTRQKIDEPDTPFVRSPESSDDEAEKAEKSVQPVVAVPREEPKKPQFQVPEEEDDRRTLSPDAMVTLTDRLNEWVDIGSPQSTGRRRHSKEESEPTTRSGDSSRRVSLVQVKGGEDKSSSNFKAQRAKHYNEFAAMKALKQKKADSDSSAASDTSDEEALRKKQTKKGVKVESMSPKDHLPGEAEAEAPTEEWRTKRNAHYRDMAAAFRSQPPEDSDDSN